APAGSADKTTPHPSPAAKSSTPASEKPQTKATRPAGTSSAAPKKAGTGKGTAAHPHAATARRRGPVSPRVRRMRQAFVASASLRPMAQQLEQDRTPAAYTGVEAFARAHPQEDAGALAWLVVGYARVLDHEYAKAI